MSHIMESPAREEGNSGIIPTAEGINASLGRGSAGPGGSPDLPPSGGQRRNSHTREDYAPSDAIYLSELAAPSPIQNPEARHTLHHESLEDKVEAGWRTGHRDETSRVSSLRNDAQLATAGSTSSAHGQRDEFESRRRIPTSVSNGQGEHDHDGYEAPGGYSNLNEVGSPAPDQNPDEARIYRYSSLEERVRRLRRESDIPLPPTTPRKSNSKFGSSESDSRVSRLLTRLYTISYLIFFSILGTLARLGLNALTTYTGAPVTTSVIWANFSGTLILGFLAESSAIFNQVAVNEKANPPLGDADAETAAPTPSPSDSERRKKSDQGGIRKPIPLYIGLATGFCGSLTSFSSFMQDFFLEMSNSLSAPQYHTTESPGIARRGIGKDIMGMMAVLIVTACVSLSALKFGAHIAILLGRFNYRLPSSVRSAFDSLALFLGVGCWAGAAIMAAVPPDRHWAHNAEQWRGQVLFAVVLAPLGCILRFYLSVKLNGTFSSFPLGTFAANTIGTAVLGMAYDLQRLPLDYRPSEVASSLVACQVLQGIMDGFCGCLTTVSTLSLELSSLRRRHAYTYGGISVLTSLAILTLVMGAMNWTVGWAAPACV